MKKGKIHLFRLLFSAIVAIAVFYVVAQEIFMFFWRFNLYSKQHWIHILTRWENGWVLRKPKEVCFFIGLLSLIPAYIGTWVFIYKFPLKKILFFPTIYFEKKKKAKLQAQSLAAALGPANKKEALSSKKEQEKVLKISSQKMQKIDQLRGKGSAHASAPHNTSAPAQNNATNDAMDRFALWEKLTKNVEAENIFVLKQMNIRSFPINLLAITQEGAFLMCEGPKQGTTWETREDLSPAVWKTETGDSILSPLTAMVNAKNILEKYLQEQKPEYSNLRVNCCMIIDHGHITNVNTLLPFLEKWDISVLRMGSCKTAELPDTNALIEYIKTQKPSSQELNDAVAIALLDLMDENNGG